MEHSSYKDAKNPKKTDLINDVLQDISRAICESIRLEDLFTAIHVALGKIIDVTNFCIAVYQSDQKTVSFPFYIDSVVIHDKTATYHLDAIQNSLTAGVISSGKPLLLTKHDIERYEQNSSYPPFGKNCEVWLGVPLLVRGNVTGVIAVQNYEDKDAFDSCEIDLLKLVSSQIAVAIELKQKEESHIRSERRFRNLVERIQEVIYLTDSEGNIVYISPSAESLLGLPTAALIGHHGFYRYQVSEKSGQRRSFNHFIFQEDLETVSGAFATALKELKPFQLEYRIKTRAGKLNWVIEKGHFFNDEAEGVKLEGLILDNQDRKRAEMINQALYNISNAVSTTADLDDLFCSIHQSLGLVLNVDNFFIGLFNKADDLITFPYRKDVIEVDDYETIYNVSRSTSLTGVVVRTGKPLLLSKRESFELVRKLGGDHIGEPAEIWLGVPLIFRSNVIGAMVLQSYDNSTLYSEEDSDILISVSEQVATAIERKRAEEELKYRKLVISTLFDISNAINTTFNLDELFRSIHTSLNKMIDVRNFKIALLDEETDTIAFAYQVENGKEQASSVMKEASQRSRLTYKVIRERRCFLLRQEQIDQIMAEENGGLSNPGYKTWLGIPLKGKNHVLGVVILSNRHHADCFSDKDIDLLNAVSDQIAFAIESKQAAAALEETQKQLIESAHKAGIAEIASGTLHDVSNILNSVKVSTDVISSINRASSSFRYKKANELLRAHFYSLEDFIVNNPKGKQLLEYYLRLETAFEFEQQQIQEQISRLYEKIQLMTEVIFDQQSSAGGKLLLTEHAIDEVLDTVLKMQADMLSKHLIHVIKQFHPVSNVIIHKTKFMHVLINLVKNAKDSLLDQPENNRELIVGVRQVNDQVHITISDNGEGISGEVGDRLFNHGFTTKKDGHGFGLHNSVNYMKDMQGEIRFESEGLGKGATFTLIVPCTE